MKHTKKRDFGPPKANNPVISAQKHYFTGKYKLFQPKKNVSVQKKVNFSPQKKKFSTDKRNSQIPTRNALIWAKIHENTLKTHLFGLIFTNICTKTVFLRAF